jgi:hypothetical protein
MVLIQSEFIFIKSGDTGRTRRSKNAQGVVLSESRFRKLPNDIKDFRRELHAE